MTKEIQPSQDQEKAGLVPARSLLAILMACIKISMLSFGGGVSALMYTEIVVRRRWLAEADFMAGLALAQAFPGVNVTNMAIWVGYRLRGTAGVVAALLGVIVPSAVLIVLLGYTVHRISGYPLTQVALSGLAAAAIGLSLALGVRAARHVAGLTSFVIMAAVAVGMGILHLPGFLIVLVLAPISIGLAYLRLRHERR